MAWRNKFHEFAHSKPLFLTIYATVIVGVVFSAVCVFSAVYSSRGSTTSWWLSQSASGSQPLYQSPDSSQERAMHVSLAAIPHGRSKVMRPIWEVPPSGSKMPPLKTFQLTRELVQQRVKDNVVIVTFGNFAFMDFILTWVKHLTDIGLSNLLVGAMDTKLLEALYWKGIPAFDMGSNMSTVDAGWGSSTFHKMGREKVILIDAMLPFGYELLMCDTDTVWLKNPLPYLRRFPEADVLTSTDQVIPTVTDDRLEIWQQVGAAYNIGIFHWRPTNSAKKLAREWKNMLLSDDKIWDQNGFNDLLRKQLGPSVGEDGDLVYAYDGNLKLGFLPASIFCSGHTYFVQATYQQLRMEPYAVHTTFQYAGTEGKRHRLREGMLFYDLPEYYDSPGGFLTFKPSIPKHLLLDGEHNIESHFSLVNYQIKQIRTALAIASLLNRTLVTWFPGITAPFCFRHQNMFTLKVMPPLWCRLDRFWFPHPGVLAGTLTRQPFICPLDHVFEVNAMLKELPEEEFGPAIGIREYSFFGNPSVPTEVKMSWLDVKLCQDGSPSCHAPNSTNIQGDLKFPKHSNEDTLKTVFDQYKDIKVIQFSSMQDAFSGFTDKGREARFRKRMKRYTGIWCCVENHIPGHIYYDMYWDEKPDWKPIPPQNPEDDHPPW